jgi:hypothetical protein
MGSPEDPFEDQAEAVAESVAEGRPAVDLLAPLGAAAPPGLSAMKQAAGSHIGATAAVNRKLARKLRKSRRDGAAIVRDETKDSASSVSTWCRWSWRRRPESASPTLLSDFECETPARGFQRSLEGRRWMGGGR